MGYFLNQLANRTKAWKNEFAGAEAAVESNMYKHGGSSPLRSRLWV